MTSELVVALGAAAAAAAAATMVAAAARVLAPPLPLLRPASPTVSSFSFATVWHHWAAELLEKAEAEIEARLQRRLRNRGALLAEAARLSPLRSEVAAMQHEVRARDGRAPPRRGRMSSPPPPPNPTEP